jgi:predicted nucleotide-binding protein
MPKNAKSGKTSGSGKASTTTSRGKPRRPAKIPEPTQKRAYLKQSDVPAASLDEALRVPEAILEHYAGKPTQPLHLAKALNVDPKGSQLKVLSGAAMAFGLTEGGSQATTIGITDLAKRILRPTVEGGADIAKREAVLTPRVFGEFLRTYNGHSFPRPDIAINVLEGMGVPRNKAAEVLERIETSARNVGYLEEIKGKLYVSLGVQPTAASQTLAPSSNIFTHVEPANEEEDGGAAAEKIAPVPSSRLLGSRSSLATAIADDERRRKVFITHGKNRDLVDPIKKLLEFGEMIPVVSVDRQSVSKPVPEKVMDDMRDCGAAIIHVDADRTIVESSGTEHVILNPNVLIEIGAAMAFYGRRFILLVKDGVKLPSNLQGLYEVRYANDTLDAGATIRLLEAIKDIKNYALPTDAADE